MIVHIVLCFLLPAHMSYACGFHRCVVSAAVTGGRFAYKQFIKKDTSIYVECYWKCICFLSIYLYSSLLNSITFFIVRMDFLHVTRFV